MSTENVKSLERALQILDCFSENHGEVSVHELHQMTGLAKSTIVRLLATLVRHDFIRQDPVSHKYTLGFKVFDLGSLFLNNLDVRKLALPYMETLANELCETINLNVVDRGERVCIEVVEAPQEVRHFVRIGHRRELYRGSSGKVLLAYLPEIEQEEVLARAAQEGVDIEKLRKELQTIRQMGYAVTRGERIQGSFSVSAPIFNYRGQLAAGLTASGPLQRLTEDRVPGIVAKIVVAARDISRQMGYNPARFGGQSDEYLAFRDAGEP